MPQRSKKSLPGRPPHAEAERRRPWTKLWANDSEIAEITRRAEQQNLPVATYIRRTAARGWVRRLDSAKLFIRSTFAIQEACRTLESRIGPTPELDQIRAELDRIREHIPHL